MPPQLNKASIVAASGNLSEVEADLLIVGCFENGALAGPVTSLSAKVQALVRPLVEGSFKARPFDVEWIYPAPGAATRVQLLGCG